MVAGLESPLCVLLDHEHRHPSVAEIAQEGEDLPDEDRGQPHRGLVDEEEARLEEHGAADLEHLLLAAAEVAGLGVGLVMQDGEQLEGDLAHPPAGERQVAQAHPTQLEVGPHRHPREDVASLGDVADPPLQQLDLGAPCQVLAVVPDAARSDLEHAEDRLEGRGLAGAVGPDDRADGVARNLEGGSVEDGGRAVAGDDVLHVQDDVVVAVGPVRALVGHGRHRLSHRGTPRAPGGPPGPRPVCRSSTPAPAP